MAQERPPLGEQELAVWRWIAERGLVSAREVVEQFAAERELARTTVLTVMERLRKKGYLARRLREGVFVYSSRLPASEVVQGLVRQFVEKMLAGSVSPLVAYLARSRELSEEELADLERLVAELRAGRPPAPPPLSGSDAPDEEER
jgi:predicted transcriptional regulator